MSRGIRSILDPRALTHLFRLVHYYNYTHVGQRRLITKGVGVRIAPNVSFANGERIALADGVQLGAHCSLWAGDNTGRIVVGRGTTFGPECFLTASNYGMVAGVPVTEQPPEEADIVIGKYSWLGARTVVAAGVTIGDDVVVGAGSVVTKDIPSGAIAAGVPARVIRMRA